jgi:hypothetical protein
MRHAHILHYCTGKKRKKKSTAPFSSSSRAGALSSTPFLCRIASSTQASRPDELMALAQTLITPNLIVAFDIAKHGSGAGGGAVGGARGAGGCPDIDDNGSGGASSVAGCSGSSDEPAQILKRPRLVWTPQLHKRFVDTVAHLGIKTAHGVDLSVERLLVAGAGAAG